jgi:hypothetical protein
MVAVGIPQATINSLTNYAKEISCCIRQMVVTPDTAWFSDPHLLFKVSVTNACISVFLVM